jgi:omega-6 fatty acid desaturase / acyl-lipid omega-6 desaturase (Delta-12 desaturase)
MSTTALPHEAALRRLATTDSTPTSSADISPADSPRPSSSSSSLSSLASNDLPSSPKLVDTFGKPFELPDYTAEQIRKAIPKHCFERSGLRGLGYVARDIISLATVFYLANRFITPENVPSMAVRAGLWAVYTLVQGLFGTGLWVLAHECGHQSFSPSKTLNDTVGFICHSALLVPYFSWKISHGKHHKATGNLERDMVFVPSTREKYASFYGKLLHEVHEITEETPIATAFRLVYQQLGGWPAYLLTNVTAHNFHERQSEGRGKGKKNGFGNGVNHFSPSSPLYEAKDAKLIVLSDVGLLMAASVLFWVGKNYGMANLFVWYILPYLWVNHWLGKWFACIARGFGILTIA